jgi:hypothetical protein
MSHYRYIDLLAAIQLSCQYCRMLGIESTLLSTHFSSTDISFKSDSFLGAEILWLVHWVSCWLDDGGIVVQLPTRQEIYLFWKLSGLVLGPSYPLVQWVPAALSAGMKLTTHLQLVLRLRMIEAIPPLLPICLHSVYRDNFTVTRFCLLAFQDWLSSYLYLLWESGETVTKIQTFNGHVRWLHSALVWRWNKTMCK